MSNAASTPASAAPAAEAPAAKKGRRGLVLIATATLVLLGGGGAAYWMLARPAAVEGEAEAEPAPQAEAKPAGAAVALEPFVVNLADPGGTRFLRVTLSLIVEDEAHALELEESALVKMRVRSAILELLAQQTADHLVTPEGKTELRKQIAEGAAAAADGVHVTDVLFSEFIVQF